MRTLRSGKAERQDLPRERRAHSGKLARVQAAQRFVGADLAAGCVERAEDTVLFLGSRRGCWVRTVANTDAPALWLLDMIRRAASGLPQAAGTSWQNTAGRSRRMC